MRVVLVIDSLGSGGAQRQLILVFNELLRQGVDVWLVYYQDRHHFLTAVPDVHRHRVLALHEPAMGASDYARALRVHLKRLTPDVVVSFLRGAAMLVAGIRMSGLAFRWIASERAGQLEFDRPARILGYLAALRVADVVAPNSAAMADMLVRMGIPRRRICVVPNGVPLAQSALDAPIARPISPIRVLLVGTRVPEKNHVAVFEALGTLSSKDFVVDHLGRCGEHPALDARVTAAIRSGGLESRVHEHGRQVDVGRWYGRANLLVHPSLSEGFPNVVLEAWSWGCPVLVSDRGDLPRIVDHGVTGLVAPLGRSNGLRDVLTQALDDPEALRDLAVAGRARVQEHYAISAIATTWRELFDGEPQDLPHRIRQRGSRMWQVLTDRLPLKEA